MGQSLGTSILERSSSKRCTGVQSQQEFCIDVIETWKYSYYSVVRVEWRHWLYMYHRRGNIEARGVRSFEELELSAARKSDLEKMISEECQRSASSCRPFSTGSAQRKKDLFNQAVGNTKEVKFYCGIKVHFSQESAKSYSKFPDLYPMGATCHPPRHSTQPIILTFVLCIVALLVSLVTLIICRHENVPSKHVKKKAAELPIRANATNESDNQNVINHETTGISEQKKAEGRQPDNRANLPSSTPSRASVPSGRIEEPCAVEQHESEPARESDRAESGNTLDEKDRIDLSCKSTCKKERLSGTETSKAGIPSIKCTQDGHDTNGDRQIQRPEREKDQPLKTHEGVGSDSVSNKSFRADDSRISRDQKKPEKADDDSNEPPCSEYESGKNTSSDNEDPKSEMNDRCSQTQPPGEVAFDVLEKGSNQFNSWVGGGNFGEVYSGKLDIHGKTEAVAIKKFKPPKHDRKTPSLVRKRQFFSEMKALMECKHTNIVQLLAYCVNSPELCLVYRYVDGQSLKEALRKTNPHPLSMAERLAIAVDTADALKYLHVTCRIVHRDVKTSNLLLEGDKTVKLADFGLSDFLNSKLEEELSSFYATQPVGTRCYMAPEAFKGKVSRKVDVYAFGMVLYEIATGLPPYSSGKATDLVTYMNDLAKENVNLAVMVDPRTQSTEKAEEASMKLFGIAGKCTVLNPRERLEMSEIYRLLRIQYSAFQPKSKGINSAK